MILSKRYKEELDKIIMTEDMKRRILHNLLDEKVEIKSTKIKKNNSFRRSILIIASCFTIVVFISAVNSDIELTKCGNYDLEQEDIGDTNKELQNDEVSKLYDNKGDSNYNKNDNEPEKREIINQYTNESENCKKSNSPEHNENSNNNENKNTNTNDKNIINNDDTNNNEDKNNDNGKTNSNTLPLTTCGGTIKEYKTLEEAEEVIKFKINRIKEIPDGFKLDYIYVIANDVIEIEYNSGKDIAKFRAGKVSENISGDYNIYENENTCEINGINIKLDGIKNKVINLATWKKADIYYSISSENGIDEEIILNMIRSSL
ncbi:hypothetical protein NNC19_22165 [Clostridium sp. SHJSY1]|uniref:hypothetical protein n=1 Tax=Clostridium sp. SHJSY1 TaxID=2942483 RepID=UPI0028768AD2|nr:hypothetical protein [Clostridium sp. SHJSY1]MDS0528398.1 hypothetical protein [Clostridium sp. SHJSY1]